MSSAANCCAAKRVAWLQALVRPAAVQLQPLDRSTTHLSAVVRDVAFAGRGYEHVVELPFGQHLSGVFAEQRWEHGDNVGVHLAATGCLAFPLNSG